LWFKTNFSKSFTNRFWKRHRNIIPVFFKLHNTITWWMPVLQAERTTRISFGGLHRVYGEQWQRGKTGSDAQTAGLWDHTENDGVQPQGTQFGQTHQDQSEPVVVLYRLWRILVYSSQGSEWHWSDSGLIPQHYDCIEWIG